MAHLFSEDERVRYKHYDIDGHPLNVWMGFIVRVYDIEDIGETNRYHVQWDMCDYPCEILETELEHFNE